MITVTVSIPTYNRSGYLKEAINSVLAQTFTDFKLLITDNCSQDGTRELVEDYITRDSRLIYHRFPSNQGPALNWRYALATPDTELVAFLLDDDLWMTKHLEHAVRAMTEFPDASLYCCKTEAFGDSPDSIGSMYTPLWLANRQTITVYDAGNNFAPLLMGTPMAASSIVFRRRFLDKVNILNDNTFYPGDYFLWAQMALQGSIVYEPVVHARYRWHARNDSVRIRGTRRASAQHRYVLRQLAIMGLKKKVLDLDRLADEAVSWPAVPLSNLIVAFAVLDAPVSLRKMAFQLFWKRRNDMEFPKISRHYQIARQVGAWYLLFADLMDRAVSGWWKPKGIE